MERNDFLFLCDGNCHERISATELFHNNHREWTVVFIAGVGPLVRCARCSWLDIKGPMFNHRARHSVIFGGSDVPND